MRQAGTSSWNTSMEMMMWCSGCNAVEVPCSSGVQREAGTQAMAVGHDPLLQPWYRMRQQRIPVEDQPSHAPRSKMKYMQQYVKEQGDTPLCNVNRAEKGTATLNEDQGEVPTVGEDRDTERIRSSRAPKPRSTDGSCLSNSFGEILRITRRQSQLESEPCETVEQSE